MRLWKLCAHLEFRLCRVMAFNCFCRSCRCYLLHIILLLLIWLLNIDRITKWKSILLVVLHIGFCSNYVVGVYNFMWAYINGWIILFMWYIFQAFVEVETMLRGWCFQSSDWGHLHWMLLLFLQDAILFIPPLSFACILEYVGDWEGVDWVLM